jgi:hypothetical protein
MQPLEAWELTCSIAEHATTPLWFRWLSINIPVVIAVPVSRQPPLFDAIIYKKRKQTTGIILFKTSRSCLSKYPDVVARENDRYGSH